MNIEQIRGLNIEGLSDEDAKKIADASENELKDYVKKEEYDKTNTELKQVKKELDTTEKALQDIKNNTENIDDLKQKITDLEKNNKQLKEDHIKELNNIKIDNAIKSNITDALDVDIVTSLLNREKIILNDDKVVGLTEQLEDIKKNKPFLFKQKEEKESGSGIHFAPQEPKPQPQQQMSLKDAIRAELSR